MKKTSRAKIQKKVKAVARRKTEIVKAPRHTLKLSIRQIKYRQNRLMGMNIANAAVAAGYSETYARTSASTITEKLVKPSIVDELERAGATNKRMAQHLSKLAFGATKMQRATFEVHQEDGEIVIDNEAREEIPDLHLQKDTIELIAKLKKQLNNSPLLPTEGFTRMTIVVERDPNAPQETDAGAGIKDRIDRPTKLSVALTHQP